MCAKEILAQALGFVRGPCQRDFWGRGVEAAASILRKFTDLAYEAKLIYYRKTFDDRVRTFCMNPFGEVVTETTGDIVPGIFSRHTLLYGVDVKFYINRVKVSSALETDIQILFLIGDGAGITGGLMQASISGILAANEIPQRIGKE